MHWFWRSTIAILVGGMLAAGPFWLIQRILLRLLWPPGVAEYFATSLGIAVASIIPLYSNSLLKRAFPCRKCGDILQGLSQQRCPECGERI